jgi:hypothetical protein
MQINLDYLTLLKLLIQNNAEYSAYNEPFLNDSFMKLKDSVI